ncbi:MAG: putative O-glycosylation ligase, exosortase A-associated [Acidobacteria bacterium]|nr:putative O-glycosylation ligase, exosortase A-associated [Acidobacteriota bacterium]
MKGLIFVYVLTALGVFGSLRKPIIGLYVYIGFAVLRPQNLWAFAGDMSNLSLMVGVAMLAGWALNGFGEKRVGRGGIVVALLLLFLCWTSLSAVQAVNPDVAFTWVIELLKIVAPFLVGITLLDVKKDVRGLIWLIVIAQAYISLEMNLSYYVDGYNRARDAGFGGMDNNSFGISLVSTIGPTLALALTEKRWLLRAGAASCAVLILHATLLTFSRGAMIGLVAVGFTAFVLMPKRPSYMAVLALAGLLALRLTGPELLARYSTTVADEGDRDDSAESRFELWRDCLKVASESPLFGIGARNWPLVAARFGWPEGKEAHSTWMQTTAETGFPGVLSLLLFFGIAAVKVWPTAHRLPTEETRYQVAGARAVVMSIAGFVVAAQFVTLAGLEIPYYMAMIGVVILKDVPAAAEVRAAMPFSAARSTAPRPGLAFGTSRASSKTGMRRNMS